MHVILTIRQDVPAIGKIAVVRSGYQLLSCLTVVDDDNLAKKQILQAL